MALFSAKNTLETTCSILAKSRSFLLSSSLQNFTLTIIKITKQLIYKMKTNILQTGFTFENAALLLLRFTKINRPSFYISLSKNFQS